MKKPKPFGKKYAEGGPVTKHQSLATTGQAPAAVKTDAGFKRGGAVKKGKVRC